MGWIPSGLVGLMEALRPVVQGEDEPGHVAVAVDTPESVLGLTGIHTRRQSHHGSAPRTAATGVGQSAGRSAVGRRILVRPLPSDTASECRK